MSDPTQIQSEGSDSETEFAASPAPVPRLKLVDVLSQDVTPQVEAVARKLMAGGDALLVKTSRNAVHGFVLDREHLDTRIEWTATELIAVCPCEMRAGGFVCPHLWATVLLADRSGAFRSLEEQPGHPIFSRGDTVLREGQRRSANAWPARAGWRIHLASIAQTGARRISELTEHVAGLPRQAVYVVDAGATRASHRSAAGSSGPPTGASVIVELQERHRKKSRPRGGTGDAGAWTRSTAVRLDPNDVETFTEEDDRGILSQVLGARPDDLPGNDTNGTGGLRQCALRGMMGIDLLRRMCLTGRCRLRPDRVLFGTPAEELVRLTWDDGPAYEFFVRIAPHDDGKHYTLTGHLRRGETVLPANAAILLAEPAVAQAGGLVFIEDRVARADLAGGLQWIDFFTARGPLHVPKSDIDEFLRQVAGLPAIPRLDLPAELKFEQLTGTPRPRLVVRRPPRANAALPAARPDERILGSVYFDYDAGAVEALAPAAGTYDPSMGKMVLRDRLAEGRALSVLKALGVRREADPETSEVFFEMPPRLLPSVVPALIREGWMVEAEGKMYRAATDFRVSVTSGIDWFDLSGTVQFGDQVVPLPRLLAAARKGEHLIRLADGTFGVLPEEWLAKYGVIVQSGTAIKDEAGTEAIRFSRAQAGMLDVLLESQPNATLDATFENLRNQLHDFGGITAQEAPASFTGTLRPYQQEGLGWFDFLRQFRFGGCLADDMGLGKTIQVLALMAGRAGETSGAARASLVVAPRSLVFNWREEAMKFSPGLRILDHTGPSRSRSAERFGEYDMVLTTYGTLRSDIVFLKNFRFDYAILDEAQAIKNAQTESAKAVRLLQADHRLALSGTPVQNHLGELWSLFEFLNPGMLGAASVFDARLQSVLPKAEEAKAAVAADVAVEEGEPADPAAETVMAPVEAVAEVTDEEEETPRQLLSRALRPFILRRTKEQVAQDLPPCTEQTIYCELDEAQRAMYDELRDHYRQTLLGGATKATGPAGSGGGSGNNRMQVLEALLRLRQAACHPGLIDKSRVGEGSAKLEMLFTQIDEVLEEHHKALVFSQFTSLLAIVRKRLDDRQVRYAYLDGKTRDRKSPVEQFQNDEATRLFLISLKAGGLGLNLTGADYVFLLDPWWNPAVEAQAIDRAHRIGQTRHVFAYRLIARGTVEEKVLQLQQTKRDLADAIISEDNAILSRLTSDDLAILLS